MPPAPPASAVPASSRLLLLAQDIKLHHSVFALPFALLAAFLAAAARGRGVPLTSGVRAACQWRPSSLELALIVLCMVFARTMAMAFNRFADAPLDARNPRTARRAVPSGRLSRRFMGLAALACAAAFVATTAAFYYLYANPYPLLLSPLVILWLNAYSLTKRFTFFSHLVLGVALALGSAGAAVAIYPPFLRRPDPWLLVASVTFWVAGFDIIYALQDVAVDRAQGLHSMPSRLGVGLALWISRLLHLLSLVALAALLFTSPVLGAAFAVSVALMAALLLLEHALVWRSATHHIHVAFFTLNGIISLLVGALGIADAVRLSV